MAERLPEERRVLLLTPSARDTELSRTLLVKAGLDCTGCAGLDELLRELPLGAGCLLVAENVLHAEGSNRLAEAIRLQPAWADLPVVMLTRGGAADSPQVQSITAVLGNISLLELPVRISTLLSAVRAALRARGRQYQIRDQIQSQLRNKEELERRVFERTAQIRALALELTQAEQRERRQLAQLLHDDLQQLLVGAKFALAQAGRQAAGEGIKDSLDKVVHLLDESINASRSLTVALSPPILQTSGMIAATQWLQEWMGEKHGLKIEVEAEADVAPDSQGVSMLLFQCMRELLFNIVKHAGTNQAKVKIGRSGKNVRIEVSDQGAGIDPSRVQAKGSASGFGLYSIRERLLLIGGQMEVESAPGQGTRVSMIAPVPPQGDSEPEQG